MPQAVYILFGAGFTVLVSMAAGKLLLRALALRLYRQEEHLLSFVAGAALLSGLMFALCALRAAYKGVFLAVGLAILLAAWRTGAHRPRGEPLPPLPRFWKWLFGAAFAVYVVLYFFNAMAPEASPDGSAYHLGLVARYLRERGFQRITTNMYANLSQGVEMLFAFAFAFGRHSAAALVHFSFLAALPLAMTFYARRFGLAAAGVCGAIFTFASPVVGVDGTKAYIDVAVACVAFALFYLLQIWNAERSPGLLIPIGLLAGFGYAAKYTALLGVPYAVAFVAWKSRHKRQWWKAAAVVALCALIPMAPWLLKNWIWLRNPVSPFFNALFPNPYVTVGFEQEYTSYLRNYDLKSAREILMAVTVNGQLSGLLGPLFLLAPAALGALRRTAGRQLLLAALVFGMAYPANVGTRFLIPPLPFLSIAMALVFLRVPLLAPALAAAHAVLSFPPVTGRYCLGYAWRLVDFPVAEALRIRPEEEFLRAHITQYGVVRMLEDAVPAGAKVLTFTPPPEAYTTRDVLVVYQSASNKVAGDILWTPLVPEYAPTRVLRFSFAARPLRRIRVVETARGDPDFWSVSELRVLRAGRELPRAPSWRLTARPNPWGVQLAFDNSPVTRWSTAQAIRPGMFMQVDFGAPQALDTVQLECSRDQDKVRLRLEGQAAAGRWETLAETPQETEGAPIPGLRRLAALELKRRGIEYLLVHDFDYGADDYRARADDWGIRQVAEAGTGRLYRIL